jgi:ABC-type dipeptide/oligopeptide/nickel transport system ATPase subunit
MQIEHFPDEIDKVIIIARLLHLYELKQTFVNLVMNLHVTLFQGQVVGTCTYSSGSGFKSGYELSCACQFIETNAGMIQSQIRPRSPSSESVEMIRP